jgi:hypothetical protein
MSLMPPLVPESAISPLGPQATSLTAPTRPRLKCLMARFRATSKIAISLSPFANVT